MLGEGNIKPVHKDVVKEEVSVDVKEDCVEVTNTLVERYDFVMFENFCKNLVEQRRVNEINVKKAFGFGEPFLEKLAEVQELRAKEVAEAREQRKKDLEKEGAEGKSGE